MTIVDTAGNMFGNHNNAQAFAHGVNCQGEMGAGIAVQFRSSYPAMYNAYRRMCLARPRELNPGHTFMWSDMVMTDEQARYTPRNVFNVASQEFYGRRGRATLEWLESGLLEMRAGADANNITSIAMPHIGCSLGGLEIPDVRNLLHRLFADWNGTIFLYAPYRPR